MEAVQTYGGILPREGSMNMVSKGLELSFDEQSATLLASLTSSFGLETPARTVREALRILYALQTHAKEGFTDVLVERPDTFAQRKLKIDFLAKVAREEPQ